MMSHTELPKQRTSSVMAAYLQHLQQKKQGEISGSRSSSRDDDHRQTIVSPLSKECSNIPDVDKHHRFDENRAQVELREDALPLSPSLIQQKQKKKKKSSRSLSRRGSKKENGILQKPPLCKHPRSVISCTTNSTYLSSDSEEDTSRSNDNYSAYSGSQHSTSSSYRSQDPSTHSNKSRNQNLSRRIPETQATNAMVPYQAAAIEKYEEDNNYNRPYLQQQHPVVSADADDDLADMHDAAFQYSDEEQDYYHYEYKQQQHHVAQVSDESSSFILHSTDDTDDDNEDDTLSDLDQLIRETSERWKQSVTETVQNTVTSLSNSAASAAVGHLQSPSSVSSSPSEHEHRGWLLLQSQLSGSISSNMTVAAADLGISSSSESDNINTMNSVEALLIQEQQVEIDALRAALEHQHPSPLQQQQQQAPVHHIQLSAPTVEDDLTVWSGFQSTCQRPDAASVVSYHSPFHNKSRSPVVKKNKTVTTTTVTLELSSAVTGITRTAIFTGTLLQQSHRDEDYDDSNKITGTGVLQFVETGDVYRGEIVDSEMHGSGTYTFASSTKKQNNSSTKPTILRGMFEHNVCVSME